MKRYFNIFVVLLLIFSFILPINAEESDELTILFTHDLHDNLESFQMLVDEEIETRGGFARLATAIEEERQIDPNALLVDAGDFGMGTLYQTIFSTESPALRLMGEIGYDATTIGNHEFDFNTKGINDSFKAAMASGDPLPKIVASNTNFPDDDMSDELKELQATFNDMDIKDYFIKNKNGIKIAIIGLMGKKADDNARDAEVEFSNMVKETKKIIDQVKKEEDAELILVLSHTGTAGKDGETEDEMLAKKVPEIDVIISGHSHTILDEPIMIGKTIIASAGRYGENLGTMKVKKEEDRWNLTDYKLKAINTSYEENLEIKSRINAFKTIVNKEYLSQYNLEFDQLIARSPFNFINSKKIGKKYEEEPLGLLIADAYKYAVEQIEADDFKKVDVAMVTPGIIRDSFVEGDIYVKDIYKVSSLGIGKDELSGYPLIDLYLTGKEIKALAEIDASNPAIPDISQLYMSSLKYSYNPHRIPYNKIIDTKLVKEDKEEDLVNDHLYRIVTNIHSAETLGIVDEPWNKFLPIKPKDVDGNEITDLEKQIIYNDGNEIKEWLALKEYLESFPEKDSLAEIDEYYSTTHGFKEKVDDKGLVARIKNPNAISIVIISIPILIIILLILNIRALIKRRNKRK